MHITGTTGVKMSHQPAFLGSFGSQRRANRESVLSKTKDGILRKPYSTKILVCDVLFPFVAPREREQCVKTERNCASDLFAITSRTTPVGAKHAPRLLVLPSFSIERCAAIVLIYTFHPQRDHLNIYFSVLFSFAAPGEDEQCITSQQNCAAGLFCNHESDDAGRCESCSWVTCPPQFPDRGVCCDGTCVFDKSKNGNFAIRRFQKKMKI